MNEDDYSILCTSYLASCLFFIWMEKTKEVYQNHSKWRPVVFISVTCWSMQWQHPICRYIFYKIQNKNFNPKCKHVSKRLLKMKDPYWAPKLNPNCGAQWNSFSQNNNSPKIRLLYWKVNIDLPVSKQMPIFHEDTNYYQVPSTENVRHRIFLKYTCT